MPASLGAERAFPNMSPASHSSPFAFLRGGVTVGLFAGPITGLGEFARSIGEFAGEFMGARSMLVLTKGV